MGADRPVETTSPAGPAAQPLMARGKLPLMLGD